MFDNVSERNEHSLKRTFHRYFLPSFGSFGQAVSEEKIFKMSLKIPKGQSESVYRRRINTMAKRKCTKGQTTINKTYI